MNDDEKKGSIDEAIEGVVSGLTNEGPGWVEARTWMGDASPDAQKIFAAPPVIVPPLSLLGVLLRVSPGPLPPVIVTPCDPVPTACRDCHLPFGWAPAGPHWRDGLCFDCSGDHHEGPIEPGAAFLEHLDTGRPLDECRAEVAARPPYAPALVLEVDTEGMGVLREFLGCRAEVAPNQGES